MPSNSARRGSVTGRGKRTSSRVGQYLIGKTIGKGTFGKVRLGTHILTGARVGLKILDKARIVDSDDIHRITREINILKLLDHPNIVKLLEVIDTPKHIYLIMELVEGGELFDYIVAHKRVREPEAARFFHQIVSAIGYCHTHAVVHRDLKPENLLLDSSRSIKVIDFGLSNMIKKGNNMLSTACGSPAYAAPEMISGNQYSGPTVDIWSAGVILFALVCGFLPFEDRNTQGLYRKILSAQYTCPPHVSDDCRDLLSRLLTVNVDQRITLAEVHKHPWMTKFTVGHPEPPLPVPGEDFEVGINEDLLAELAQFGFDPEEARAALQSRRHNQITATYHLLEAQGNRNDGERKDFDTRQAQLEKLRSSERQAVSSPRPALPAIPDESEEEEESEQKGLPVVASPLPAIPARRRSTDRARSSSRPVEGPPLDAYSTVMHPASTANTPRQRRHSVAVSSRHSRRSASVASPERAGRSGRRASIAVSGREAAVSAHQATGTSRRRSREQEDRPAVLVGGAFNLARTSTKRPHVVLSSIAGTLNKCGMKFSQDQDNPYLLRVRAREPDGELVQFEVEVCLLDGLEDVCVARMKRVAGSAWAFKSVAAKLTDHLDIK